MRIKCNLFENFRDFDERHFRKFQKLSGNFALLRGVPGAATPEHGGFSRTDGDSFKKISTELLFFKESFFDKFIKFLKKMKDLYKTP